MRKRKAPTDRALVRHALHLAANPEDAAADCVASWSECQAHPGQTLVALMRCRGRCPRCQSIPPACSCWPTYAAGTPPTVTAAQAADAVAEVPADLVADLACLVSNPAAADVLRQAVREHGPTALTNPTVIAAANAAAGTKENTTT